MQSPPTAIRRTAVRVVTQCLLLLICLQTGVIVCAADAPSEQISEAIRALNANNFAAKRTAAAALAEIDHPRVEPLLTALLEGELATLRSTGEVVLATRNEAGYAITDPLTGESRGKVGRRDIRRISIDNKLRTSLRELLARHALTAGNAARRLESVRSMFGARDESTRLLLRDTLTSETDTRVQAAILDALALIDLYENNPEKQSVAMQRLSGNVHSSMRARLAELKASPEASEDIRKRAASELIKIEQKLEFFGLAEVVFFGLSLGSVLVLASIGLAITFGVMGVINMAHGELIMLGAYTTYVVQLVVPVDLSLFVAIPAAFLVAGITGIGIERGVIRFLYGRPLETLLATFGISLVLQQLVRSIFSPLNRSVSTPEWMSGSLELLPGLAFTFNRLYILAFSLLVFFALLAVLQRTRLGLEVRAVAQNRQMARALGVRSAWVDSMTFGLGSGIAGVAGVALSQITNVGPNLGQNYIVDCFMVVVFGGVGNIWGTLVGGLSLGVANKFLEPFAGAVVAKILVLVFIILFIQKRPSGLFPQKGRAAEG